MEIFIDNLNAEMSYHLKLQCLPSFKKLIENDIQIEEASIKKGTFKFSKAGASSSNNTYNNNYYNNYDKSKFWTMNKNVVNDGVLDNVKAKQPMLNLSDVTPPTNTQSNINQRTNTQGNTNQRPSNLGTNNQGNINQGNINQGNNPNTKPIPYRRKFAPLGQTLESAF